MDNNEPAPLSREELYELAWSKPMSALAKDFGISDVALAKRCRGLGIPLPGRGYWARVNASQSPPRAALPDRESRGHDRHAPNVAPSAALIVPTLRSRAEAAGTADNPSPDGPERISEKFDAAWLAERTAFEARAIHLIQVPALTRTWHPAIRTNRDDLEKAAAEMRASRKAADRYDQWPASRKRAGTCNESWRWQWSKDRGQRLADTRKPAAFRVSLETYERALHITNTLALAASARGYSVRDDKELGRLVFAGHDSEIQMRIAELLERKHRLRDGFDGKAERESYLEPTGRLRISLQVGYGEGPAFQDHGTQKLDAQLNRLFITMYRLTIKFWERKRERQKYKRQLEETERRRAEAERIQMEQERNAAEERKRRERLLLEAENWSSSRHIREYLAHIQAAAMTEHKCPADVGWIEWALHVAEELDPTALRLSKPQMTNE